MNSDGTDKGIIRRMDNDTCRRCHEEYKKKFPGQQFQIKCRGIYDEDFFQLKYQQMQELGEPMSLDQIREIYDPSFWAERHMIAKNADNDFVPFMPRWYQRDAMICTAPRKVDRLGRGMGKALALDTPIPTPIGWKTMGDLNVGDQVFDEKGKPTTITFVADIMYDHKCYDVVFSDGSVITADADHLWETWTKSARRAKSRNKNKTGKAKPIVITTEQILHTLFDGKEHNHSIQTCGALQYSEKQLPIHPYILGAWLGDGNTSSCHFTTIDTLILEEFEKLGTSNRKIAYKYGYSLGCKPMQINPLNGRIVSNGSLTSKLKALKVLNNKHIPREYIEGSINQRLALLQGLMDTDGNIRDYGWAEFDNTNRTLSEAVFELVVSLGMKASFKEKPAILNGKVCGTDYRVGFFPTIPVFRLPRKLDRLKKQARPSVDRRFIVEIKERPSVPVVCIKVENDSHLFLAGKACIPTHNTAEGVCEELHQALTRKQLEIMIICPQQTQAESWYLEILFQLENSPTLGGVLAGQKQSPYYMLRFNNGSIIKIFTAGSGSGKKGGSMRGQNPRRIRIDEQDFLSEADYDAIQPLLRRFKELTFHGSSTPTGLRSTYYRMCRVFPDHREFYHPIMDHPDWSEEMKEACLREAKTSERYMHEYLAEFGSPAAGVFKAIFIDHALNPFSHNLLRYDPACNYVMGVDWNGEGTGTRIYVVEFNPETRRRRTVDRSIVDEPDATTVKSIAEIKRLNRRWMCDHIYVDAGFGASQDELIRMEGQSAGKGDPQTYKLKNIHKIDFGGTLDFNKLVPNREPGEKKTKESKKEDLETRRTKPFMVEGCVMAMEQELVDLSQSDDDLLVEQMRGYRVRTWSAHGMPASYETDADSGDHDLDAFMLAMLGIEINYGLYHTNESIRRLAQIVHVTTWGSGVGLDSVPRKAGRPEPIKTGPDLEPENQNSVIDRGRQALRNRAGITSRLAQMARSTPKIVQPLRSGAYVVPGQQTNASSNRVPSRTASLTNQQGPQRGASPFFSIGSGITFGRR